MASDAYQHAVTLMRPEYRAQVDAKYAKKIEAIVRRAPRAIKGHSAGSDGNGGLADASADSASAALPCPVCDSRLAGMETVCHQCRTTLPVCIATGEHIACSDLAACPECDFPCFRAAMTRWGGLLLHFYYYLICKLINFQNLGFDQPVSDVWRNRRLESAERNSRRSDIHEFNCLEHFNLLFMFLLLLRNRDIFFMNLLIYSWHYFFKMFNCLPQNPMKPNIPI